MRDLVVLSPCFYPNASCAKLMLQSACAHGLIVELYGIGSTFFAHGADAQVAKLYDLMLASKLADVVLVTDCRDVLFTADADEILTKFHAFRAPLVMSTEQGCWPPDPEIVDFFRGRDPSGYNYVNAGQYIGTWEYVLHCLSHLLTAYRGKHAGADNSQGWWMWAKMRGELDFALDSGCRIFQTMSGRGADHVVVDNGYVRNWVTVSDPCSVHFNGNPGVVDPHGDMYRKLFL